MSWLAAVLQDLGVTGCDVDYTVVLIELAFVNINLNHIVSLGTISYKMQATRQLLQLLRPRGFTRFSSLQPLNPYNPLPRRTLPRLLSSQSSAKSHQAGSETGQSGPSEEAKDRARRLTVATASATAFFGASYILYLQLKVKAASDDEDSGEVRDIVDCTV